jgi:hypothetical protein
MGPLFYGVAFDDGTWDEHKPSQIKLCTYQGTAREKAARRTSGGATLKRKAPDDGRCCLPQSLHLGLQKLVDQPPILEDIMAALMMSEFKDPSVGDANDFLAPLGWHLQFLVDVTNSPSRLLQQTSGVFLCRIKMTAGDMQHSMHFAIFSDGRLDDAEGSLTVEPDDLQGNKAAGRAIQRMFPGQVARLQEVYKFTQI